MHHSVGGSSCSWSCFKLPNSLLLTGFGSVWMNSQFRNSRQVSRAWCENNEEAAAVQVGTANVRSKIWSCPRFQILTIRRRRSPLKNSSNACFVQAICHTTACNTSYKTLKLFLITRTGRMILRFREQFLNLVQLKEHTYRVNFVISIGNPPLIFPEKLEGN